MEGTNSLKAVRTAWVMTLGTEVVDGRVVNTNASFLGRRLTVLGFRVLGNISLVDDIDLISKFIAELLEESPSLIVTSGGLGPTYDDVTLEAVAKAAGVKLELNSRALEMIKEKYGSGGYTITEEMGKMALLPKGAEPIPNPVGTAPGSWLQVGGTVIVSLPGVPKELEEMWIRYVEPRLRELIGTTALVERYVEVRGLPEALISPVIKELVRRYRNVYIKSHPKGREVEAPHILVYVQAVSTEKEPARRLVDSVVSELIDKLKKKGAEVSLKC